MYKYVLVPATGAASDEAVFETALLAARPFSAHLEFLHVRVDVTEIVISMSTGGLGGGGAVQGVVDKLEAEVEAGRGARPAAGRGFLRRATPSRAARRGRARGCRPSSPWRPAATRSGFPNTDGSPTWWWSAARSPAARWRWRCWRRR